MTASTVNADDPTPVNRCPRLRVGPPGSTKRCRSGQGSSGRRLHVGQRRDGSVPWLHRGRHTHLLLPVPVPVIAVIFPAVGADPVQGRSASGTGAGGARRPQGRWCASAVSRTTGRPPSRRWALRRPPIPPHV